MAFRDLDDLRAALHAAADLNDEGDTGPTILEHGLQCAALLAESHPDDAELQVAGLVHDVGWLTRDGGRWVVGLAAAHDAAGAALVEGLLGPRVARLVGGHVDAKRYLVTRDADYGAKLSGGSTYTLSRQGGAMSDTEADAFERRDDFAALVALRRADEAAKLPPDQVDVAELDAWNDVLERVAG